MILAQILYLILPLLVAGVAHSVAIKRNALPGLARPLDGNLHLAGKPLFGENKTLRGPVIMTAGSLLAVLCQRALYPLPGFHRLSLIDYDAINVVVLGAAFGLSYSLAELPNSFVKRRLGIAPGELSAGGVAVQYLADQADSVVGGALALFIVLDQPAKVILLAAAVGLGLHILFDQALYATGVKPVPAPGGGPLPAVGWFRRQALLHAPARATGKGRGDDG